MQPIEKRATIYNKSTATEAQEEDKGTSSGVGGWVFAFFKISWLKSQIELMCFYANFYWKLYKQPNK